MLSYSYIIKFIFSDESVQRQPFSLVHCTTLVCDGERMIGMFHKSTLELMQITYSFRYISFLPPFPGNKVQRLFLMYLS